MFGGFVCLLLWFLGRGIYDSYRIKPSGFDISLVFDAYVCVCVCIYIYASHAIVQTPSSGLRHPFWRKVPESSARSVATVITCVCNRLTHR